MPASKREKAAEGQDAPGRFYITTAIDYVNSKPHLGHAYEKVVADCLARWHRLLGEDVLFLTGTDENGQKIAQAAAKAGVPVRQFVDANAALYRELCKAYGISNDDFIRTTEARHARVAQDIFRRMLGSGDIYKGEYEGLYCYGCEAFLTEKELKDGKCPIHDKAPEPLKEESYFFRLSRYRKHVEGLLRDGLIFPPSRSTEMLNRVGEGLKDLSVSRHNVEWGIPVPSDGSHRIYVWMEALENYVSALGYPGGEGFRRFWPADLHVIGGEISWFHTVIWPAMLASIGAAPPRRVLVHGIITLNGRKMSKSLGNVVDPIELVGRYPADAVRYFLLREIPLGEDGDFSEASLKERLNNELANDLGNLVSRALTLAERCKGVPAGEPDPGLAKALKTRRIARLMEELRPHHALDEIWMFVRAVNRYINEKEPWKLEGDALGNVLYNVLESLRMISILLSAFMPGTSARINAQLGVRPGTLEDLGFREWKGRPRKGDILFSKAR
jgi:methionyl-tRNA synthetase